MLNKLFGSELRARVLEKILAQPDQKYYSQALSRDLKVLLNSLRRELDNLEKLGLIVSLLETGVEDEKTMTKNKSKEKKYFMVNKNFLLFDELKSLFAKAELFFVQEFLGRLEKVVNLKYFVLTGQFSGNLSAMTDILVVGRVRREKFLPLIDDLEKKLGREVNFTIMDETEFYYRRDIMDIFLYNILNNKQILIVDNLEAKPKAKTPVVTN